jgi:Ca-activated chloride channel family protein
LLAIAALIGTASPVKSQQPERPTFRSSVAVVPITAVVRDSRRRIVRDLTQVDFEVLEQGRPRRILDFRSNVNGPVSVAFLFDTSGSMGLVSNLGKGKEVVTQLLARMQPAKDEAALFTFHKELREEVAFTSNHDRVRQALDEVRPWGVTSLYDAIAETARRLTDRAAVRRAIVVISDGIDTSSVLTPSEVARLASAIDVPVYVVAVVSPLDDPARNAARPDHVSGALRDVAELTGGDVVYVRAFDAAASLDELMAAMKYQYVLAIESSPTPGWYPLEVKTRRKGLSVRARHAYSSEAVEGPAR